MAVKIWPLVRAQVRRGGVAETAAYGPMRGGIIANPYNAVDQGLAVAQQLIVNLVEPAGLGEKTTDNVLNPGAMMQVPADFDGAVSINSAYSGHRISGVVVHDATEVIPFDGEWPPLTYVTNTKLIPSYLYVQYNDDEDLQAFVRSYNEMAQQYITWFAEVMLPVYTNPNVAGTLLDWVAEGLYGMKRPVLPTGNVQSVGPINSFVINTLPINGLQVIGPSNYYLTNDDIFRRILTWHLWKGDGKLFDIRWLKRRIMRFLTGPNGGPGETDDTYPVSVTFGVGNQVNINLQSTYRYATGGAVIGAGIINDFVINDLITDVVVVPISPYVEVFKAAVESGVLELPFQFEFIVNIN